MRAVPIHTNPNRVYRSMNRLREVAASESKYESVSRTQRHQRTNSDRIVRKPKRDRLYKKDDAFEEINQSSVLLDNASAE